MYGNLSSWSSLECSPPCHGGERGFDSRRGRLPARYANRQSGQAQTLVIVCGFDSHPCYCNGPVVGRQRLLAHIQATMVRVHPGSLLGLLVQEEGAGSARRK